MCTSDRRLCWPLKLVLRLCGRGAGARVEKWMLDEKRRAANLQAARDDALGWLTAAALVTALLAWRIGHVERLPGLALACAPGALLLAGLAGLAGRRPQTYARYREPLISSGILATNLMCRAMMFWGGTNHFVHHRGSAALLLLLVLVDHYASWSALFAVIARLDRHWAAVFLPLTSALPLLLNAGPCDKILAAPGGPQVLADIHAALHLLHAIPLGPAMSALHSVLGVAAAPAGAEAAAAQQCRVLDRYLGGAVGVVLPLLVLRALERAAERERRRLRAAAGEPRGQFERSEGEALGGGGGGSWQHAYLSSCLMWVVASALR